MKFIKEYWVLIALFSAFFASAVFAQEVLRQNLIKFGIGESPSDKIIEFNTGDGVNNRKIIVDEANKDGRFTVNKFIFGDSLDTNKVLDFDIGSGALNPRIFFDTVEDELMFTNNGVDIEPIGSGSGGGREVNLLIEENFNFERGLSGWTVTGGTLTEETTAPLFGDSSLSWNAGGVGLNLNSETVAITAGFVGNSCQAEASYIYSGATDDYAMQVIKTDAASVESLIGEVSIVSSAERTRAQLFFDCPDVATDRLTLRFVSKVATTANLILDDTFLGTGLLLSGKLDLNVRDRFLSADSTSPELLTDLSFNDLTVGRQYRITINMHSDTVNNDPGDAGIIAYSGTGRTALDQLCRTTYRIDVSGSTFSTGLEAGCSRVFTATSPLLQVESVGDISPTNFIRGTGDVSGANVQLEEIISGDSINLATTGSLYQSRHLSDCSFDIPAGTGSLMPFTSDASCSYEENRNIGFTVQPLTTGGDLLPGLLVNFPYTGDFRICVKTKQQATNVTATINFLRNDTELISAGLHAIGTVSRIDGNYCGTVRVDDLSQNKFEFQGAVGTASSLVFASLGGSPALEWEIFPINQQFPSPVFTDLNDELDARVESLPNTVIHSCHFTFQASPSSLITQPDTQGLCGAWIDSATRIGQGQGTVFFKPGTFSAPPTCFTQYRANEVSNGAVRACTADAFNRTDNVGVSCKVGSATTFGTNVDVAFYLTCHGPK